MSNATRKIESITATRMVINRNAFGYSELMALSRSSPCFESLARSKSSRSNSSSLFSSMILKAEGVVDPGTFVPSGKPNIVSASFSIVMVLTRLALRIAKMIGAWTLKDPKE